MINATRGGVPILAACICLLAYPAASNAGIPPPTNELFGFVNADMTLTYASPGPVYHVLGDVIVMPGVTLDIEPGVTLEFVASSDILGGGDYISLGELLIRGTLLADASLGDSIRFVSSAGGDAEWGGIQIESGALGVMKRIGLRNAIRAFRVHGQLTIENSSIDGNACAVLYGGVLNLTSSVVAVRSSAITYALTSELNVINCNLSGGSDGLSNRGPTTIQDCQLSGFRYGIQVHNGPANIEGIELTNVLNGIYISAPGSISDCSITGRGEPFGANSYGFGAHNSGLSTAPPDTLDPQPILVSGFETGVVINSGVTVQNVIAFDNYTGINSTGTTVTVNYCTAVRNRSMGINLEGVGALILNSIAAMNDSWGVRFISSPSWVDYTDSWLNHTSWNYGVPTGTRGPNTESFNPFFVDEPNNDFHLADNSIFKVYGNSGGEIGAYGPGPGPPTTSLPEPTPMTWGKVKGRYR